MFFGIVAYIVFDWCIFMRPAVYLCVRSIAKILLEVAYPPLPCDKTLKFETLGRKFNNLHPFSQKAKFQNFM